MSKDSPTQYHTRTLDLFFKSYFAGYPSLNEAADVIFSANNLDNHNLITPSIIYDIEEYLAKAKIHSFEPGIGNKEQSHMFGRGNVKSKGVGKKHAYEATQVFNLQDWNDTKPDDKDSIDQANMKAIKRRKMIQRFLGWQMQTQPREGTSPDENPHPVHNLNMFHEGKLSSSGATSILMQYVNQMFFFKTDGKRNCKLVDEAMNNMGVSPKMSHTKNMGEWSNSPNDASFTKQINDCVKRFTDEYRERFGEPDNKGIGNKAIQMKMWELRGVPKDVVWDILCDEDGWKRGDDYMDATKTLGLITQDPQNAQYKAGFFALYLGIPLLEYEDQLKVCEWFLDGAGNAGDGQEHNDFDDKVINRILGHNARGFLTRSTQGFANALHAKYTGNPSTTGHNGIAHGERSRSEWRHGVGGNRKFYKHSLAPYDKETETRSIDMHVLEGMGLDSKQYNDLLDSITSTEDESKSLLDVIGTVDADDLPYFNEELDQSDLKNFALEIAEQYG